MSFSQRDQTILSDLGKAQAIHQDLKELLDFYENLFRAQFAFKSQLGASGKAGDLAKEEVNLTGLTNGLPQITFKELNMRATPFLDLYKSIVKLLIPYAGDSYGLETEPPPGKIIEWAREIFVSRGPLVIAGAAGDWARTASGYVLAPYLQLACDLILPRIPLNLWYREYCPDEGFKAIFIAEGTPAPRVLTFGREKVQGQELSGVMYGNTFLYEVSHGNIKPGYFKGQKVIVIGGGNVAFDVARTARRLGGETTIVSLECENKKSKDGIPADEEEIRGAWEDGIRIVYSRGVRKIIGEGLRVKSIECPRCTSVFDESGFNPQFDTSDNIELNGDVLIITVGQGPERATLQKEDLLDEKGMLAVDPLTLQSWKKEWVFMGGDLRRIGFMAEAMKEGLVAAESIERYLRGLDIQEGRKIDFESPDIPLRRYYLV